MTNSNWLFVVMSNPPEANASYAQSVWDDEELADEAAEDVSFGYVTEVSNHTDKQLDTDE
jgi:hypothetical protein